MTHAPVFVRILPTIVIGAWIVAASAQPSGIRIEPGGRTPVPSVAREEITIGAQVTPLPDTINRPLTEQEIRIHRAVGTRLEDLSRTPINIDLKGNRKTTSPVSVTRGSVVLPKTFPSFSEENKMTTTSAVQSTPDHADNDDRVRATPLYTNLKVKLGDEVLFEDPKYADLLKGKRIGLVTNPTGMDSRFVSTIDKLASNSQCKLTALFAPEHGIRGAEVAGEAVKSGIDPVTSVPVYSLHGKDENKKPLNKPTTASLENVDVLMFDIQDIGNRSYTYPGTMRLCMEAAKESGKKFVVLDRPNPMGGEMVDGNVLDPKYLSLVGWAPVGYLYGLTIGEVAMFMNEKMNIGCDLTVVPMKGWKRSMKWWDTGLPWVPTSTHMQHAQTVWHIAITGTFGELHSINEGVGYPAPFEYIGAPWIDSVQFADELNRKRLPGLFFRPVYYKPYYHIHEKKLCGGVQVLILDFDKVRPVEAGTHIMEAIHKLYPEADLFKADDTTTVGESRVKMFTKVMGSEAVRDGLLAGKTAEEINESWRAERDAYAQERRKYFLYD